MNHKIIIILLLSGLMPVPFTGNCDILQNLSEHTKQNVPGEKFCIAFYNVENLFDTTDDPNVDDEEFTPNGKQHWTGEKYALKIANIAKVIRAMNNGNGADVVGFAEVENRKVLEDLIADPQLKNLDYRIEHHDSPDKRGIDVAMIYKKNVFKILSEKFFTVNIQAYDDKPTRDIVMVQGIAGPNDTLTIFLNHWPSRREGKEISEPKRIAAATVLKKEIDSLMTLNPDIKILALGDFNDNPTDKSIHEILAAAKTPDPSKPNLLYDCDFNFDWKKGEGTEFYRGEWSRFIQIIVSTSLIKNQLNSDGSFDDVHIFKPDWLLKKDETSQQMVPMRTFQGDGETGFSDHLPVFIEIND